MKNIKTFIIGFLSSTCIFLFLGNTNKDNNNNNNNNKYQLSATALDTGFFEGYFEIIFNTETGEVLSRKKIKQKDIEYIKADK